MVVPEKVTDDLVPHSQPSQSSDVNRTRLCRADWARSKLSVVLVAFEISGREGERTAMAYLLEREPVGVVTSAVVFDSVLLAGLR